VRRQTQVQVVIRQSALNQIHRHGKSTTEVEVCGVLVGDLYRDERGPFVYVEACILGTRAASHSAQVTFTAETWTDIQMTLDKEYAGRRIVGWYHTHPGFGIFLSAMDMFIHENFFNGCDQLALVFDPLQAEEGLFVWRGGQPVAEPFSMEPDADDAFPGIATHVATRPAMTAAAATSEDAGRDAQVAALAQRTTNLERKQTQTMTWLLGGMATLALWAFLWPIAWGLWLQPRFGNKPAIETPGDAVLQKPRGARPTSPRRNKMAAPSPEKDKFETQTIEQDDDGRSDLR
jgi:proteasome lid subunit RPN8/RPN11